MNWPAISIVLFCIAFWALFLWSIFAHAAEFYVHGLVGVSKLGGAGTQTYCDVEANPYKLPNHVIDTGALTRVALGARTPRWGIEIGYGRLGHYSRSLEPVEKLTWDTTGEIATAQALDLRALHYWPLSGRLEAYGFVSGAAVFYQREVWTGHYVNGRRPVARFDSRSIEDTYAQWKKSDGTTPAFGGGLGLEYKLSSRWSLTGEASGLWGEFNTHSVGLGMRYYF